MNRSTEARAPEAHPPGGPSRSAASPSAIGPAVGSAATQPFSPRRTISEPPARALLSTGTPEARASRCTLPKGSYRAGSATASAAA